MNKNKKNNKKTNKGFTFVEVLAVVSILGVLASIAIFRLSKYKNDAISKDYEALAKASYNAMEEYIMVNPYKTSANLQKLEEDKFLSNRKDPASKSINCDGAVVVESENGTDGKMNLGIFKVYLCCPNYKKIYTYPDGKVENLDDDSLCVAPEEEDDPVDPTPPTPPSPTSKSVLVTFDCNGGSKKSGPSTATYFTEVSGQKFETTCKLTGQIHDGWKTDKNGSEKEFELSQNVTDDFVLTYTPSVTLYANWNDEEIECSPGNYLKKKSTSCTKCEANYYCPGGKFTYSTTKDQGKNNCDEKTSGYNKSPAGSSSISNCYISVTAGNYIKTKNNSAQTKCSSGSYRTSHTVNYGNTSSCTTCPTGYGNSSEGSDAATDCYMKVSKNHYVKTKKATSATSCATNYFSDAHNVYYGSTSSCSIGALLKLQADAPAVSSVKIDSGTAGTSVSKYVKKGSEVTITATTKNYYQFSSWKSSNTVISSDKSAVIKVNSNMTVTAYGRANVLKLSYYSNGGHLAPSPGTYCPQTAGCTGSICNKDVDYVGCKNKSGLVFQTSGTYDNIHLASTGVFDYQGYESAGLYMEKSGATAKGKWAVGSSTGSVKINQDTTYNTFAAFANACGGSYGSDFKKKDINISLYAQW